MICTITGNIGQDPTSGTARDQTFCRFSIADRIEKDKIKWRNITVWGKQGENCKKFLTKGQFVTVIARATYSEKDNKEYENFQAMDVIFGPKSGVDAGDKKSDQSQQQQQSAAEAPIVPPSSSPSALDDIPF